MDKLPHQNRRERAEEAGGRRRQIKATKFPTEPFRSEMEPNRNAQTDEHFTQHTTLKKGKMYKGWRALGENATHEPSPHHATSAHPHPLRWLARCQLRLPPRQPAGPPPRRTWLHQTLPVCPNPTTKGDPQSEESPEAGVSVLTTPSRLHPPGRKIRQPRNCREDGRSDYGNSSSVQLP
jgi:hypothetical protein